MSDQPTPIDQILNPPAPAADPAPQSEPVTTDAAPEGKEPSGQPRDETGKFAPKQAAPATSPEPTGEKIPPAAPPAATTGQPPPGFVPTAALVDTRVKYQQAEQRNAELQRRLDDIEKAKNAQPVDWFTDPDAAIRQHIAPIQERFNQTLSSVTLRASKAEAIADHGRAAVAEMEKVLGEAMEAGDPEVQTLRQQLLQTDHPVGLAMDWFQRKRVLAEVGNDPVAYRERVKAEVMAEMKAGAQQPQAPQPSLVMPSNIAGARNVGNRAGPTWSGPTPLADIFKRS